MMNREQQDNNNKDISDDIKKTESKEFDTNDIKLVYNNTNINTHKNTDNKTHKKIDIENQSPNETQSPVETQSPNEIQLLNQGAFGCVYRPNINCDGEIGDKRFVTKIQIGDENIKNELSISEKIIKIPNYQFFFAPLLQSCNVSISSIKEEQRKECNILNKEDVGSQKTFLSTKIRFVGNKNIEQYFLSLLIIEYLKSIKDEDTISYLTNEKNLKLYIKEKTYLQTLKPIFLSTTLTKDDKTPHFFMESIMIKKITSTYYHLLKALQKLQEINIIHNDIKEPNIIYDEWNHSPMIIDFGISYDLTTPPDQEQLLTYFYTADYYIYWCIDIFIISYIVQIVRNKLDNTLTNIITEENINNLIKNFIEKKEQEQQKQQQKQGLKNYLNTPSIQQDIDDFEIKIKNFLNTFIGKDWEELFNFLFKKEIYSTWDNYSLAMTYYFISDSIHFIEYENNVSKQLIQLWKSIIFAIPGERKTIEETIIEWKKI